MDAFVGRKPPQYGGGPSSIDIHNIMSMQGSENIVTEHQLQDNWKILKTSDESLSDTMTKLMK